MGWVVVGLLVVVPSTGLAQKPAPDALRKAKVLFELGETEYSVGNFIKSLEHYSSALRLVRRANLMFNIAQCHRMLDNKKKSLFFYELFLSQYAKDNAGSAPPVEKEVRKWIGQLRKQIARAASSKSEPASSQPVTATTKPTTEPATSIPAVADGSEVAPTHPVSNQPEPSPSPSKPQQRIWTWVAGGAALLSAGTALGLWFSGNADVDKANSVQLYSNEWQEIYDSVEKKDLAANILGYGVTSALVVTAVVLYFVEGRKLKTDSMETMRKWPMLTVGARGATIVGQF